MGYYRSTDPAKMDNEDLVAENAALIAEEAALRDALTRAKPLLEDGGSCLLDNAGPNAGRRAFALADEIRTILAAGGPLLAEAALRDAASILRKLAVYCDFREMQGACEFNDSEMAYLTALAAGDEIDHDDEYSQTLIDACAFALRGNYPEVLRDFDAMPGEIERLWSQLNDSIDENNALIAEAAALRDALMLAQQIGHAYRGDWLDFDGRTLRDQMDDLSEIVDGSMTVERFRAWNELCPIGGGHWTEHCSEACREAAAGGPLKERPE